MSIQFYEDDKVFVLETNNTSYQFKIAGYGFVEHLYYGKKVHSQLGYLSVRIRHGFEVNSHEAELYRTISLDVIQQEYPNCSWY